MTRNRVLWGMTTLLLCLLGTNGCTPKLATMTPDPPYEVVEVFYGTDRNRTGSMVVNEIYGGDRSDASFEYGVCSVSIPPDHRIGRVERPTWWKFEFREDPEKHVVLLSADAMASDPFFTALRETVARSTAHQAFVFIHGYNVSFAEAARRTGQLAYDLRFDGAPILYSWPSRGEVAAYGIDGTNVEWTVTHLKAFLADVATKSGAETVHLIAHSMGNRALTAALGQLALEGTDLSEIFKEVVLTAPDIDAEVFARDIAPRLGATAKRVTLYASSNDKALKLSKTFHGYRRAGDTEGGIVVADGVISIDASAVETGFLGHSYFGDNTTVVADLFRLLRWGRPPGERLGMLRKVTPEGSEYWAFLPGT